MHDLKMLRERLDVLRDGMRRRGQDDLVERLQTAIQQAEVRRREVIRDLEDLKAKRNVASAEVARLKRAGKDAESMIAESRGLGDRIAALEGDLAAVEGTLEEFLLSVPNITLPEVPDGGEEHNRVVRSWGDPRPTEGVVPHWEIATRAGLVDFERGAKVSGSGFLAFRGAGARLVRSLITWMLDLHATEHGYEEIWAPSVVNRAAMTGTGQLPKFEDDVYALREEGMYLIPTAEVPVTNLYRDETLDAAELPRGFVAYTPCFRREAGAAGKDTRGLLRLHLFDKVELVRYATPETSSAQLELLTGHAEVVLQRLGLPYRVVLLASGDTGFASAKTYDLEVWSPGVGRWLEVSSCSTFGEFQARRMNLRYRPGGGEKPRFVHTLNGSGLALPRVIAALLEHHQRPDGGVGIPPALRAPFGADRIG
jgi:seryl-tRNA synthetase